MQNITKSTKLTLLLISLTTMMSNVAIVTIIPKLKYYYDNENIELIARMMVTVPSLVVAILSPFLIHLIYKFGKKNSTIFALILFSISGSAGVYLESINMILFSRACLGASISMLMIITTSLIGDYFKGNERNKYMGIQQAFISFGGILFLVGGGILGDISWRYSFGIYLVGFILLPFAIKYLYEVEHIEKENEKQELNLNKNLYFVYFLAFFFMIIFYILPTQMPFLMINHFNATSTLTGLIISVAFFANALGAMSFNKLKNKFEHKTIYLIGLFIIAIGYIIIGLVPNVYYFFLTSMIVGLGGGIMTTNIVAWMLSKVDYTKRIKSSGYLTSSLFIGQFVSPFLSLPIVNIFGVQDFFIILGLFLVTIILINFFIKSILKHNLGNILN